MNLSLVISIIGWIICLISVPLTLYLGFVVHCKLDQICVWHAKKFCNQHRLEVSRVRWQPAFTGSGGKRVKTESTLVQLDCCDDQNLRRLVLILVWPFGVRKMVSNEKYPESLDDQWPKNVAKPPSKPTWTQRETFQRIEVGEIAILITTAIRLKAALGCDWYLLYEVEKWKSDVG